MAYEFDKIIDRKGTNCLKYDFARERGHSEEELPLWVADMDFQTAPEIVERLQRSVAHGIFGYSEGKDSYFQALAGWYEKHFGWTVKREWLVKTPGVVFAIAAAVRAFTKEGDAVLLQQPVYYPFSEAIKDNGRELVNSPLKLVNGHYEMDFEDLEQKIVEHQVKLFLLCSPHNPVGRVWTEEELRRVGDLCVKHNVLVVSDEIHSDFTWPGHEHHVFANLDPKYAEISITCTAPSKTFNLAGLVGSYHIIYNSWLRDRCDKEGSLSHYNAMNVMSMHALLGAYKPEGYEWVEELRQVITGNVDFACDYIAKHFDGVEVSRPQGTYMLFLDCGEWLTAHGKTMDELLAAGWDVGVIWQDGRAFHGQTHIRMNLALPLSRVREAFRRLDTYVFNA